MRYLGLGIEEAHHPWSENTRSFTSQELLDHLVDKVIPHEKTINNTPENVPSQLPTSLILPSIPNNFQVQSPFSSNTV